MKVFVTGGTGFIGSLVVQELINSNHKVLGLARSDKAEQSLKEMGAETLHGSLNDLEVLKQGASSSDAVIHMGFSNDFNNYNEAVEMDLNAVKAIGSVLEGTDKAFVNTTGTLGVSNLGKIATEKDSGPIEMPRVASEKVVLDLAQKGVRSSVVRLAPCVHGINRHGLASILMDIAAQKGISAYVDEGENLWPAVHHRDAAHLFCLAVESAPAGSVLHAVSEEGISLKEIAEVIGRNLNIPVESISNDDAKNHFGFFAASVTLNNPTSSTITKELLNWTPTNETLVEDINSFYKINK